MTEIEWSASEDPQAMLRSLELPAELPQGRSRMPSDRKLRLFAVACCREVWHLLTDERSRKAVEVAERYADGLATKEDIWAARGCINPGNPTIIPEGGGSSAFLATTSQFDLFLESKPLPERSVQANLLRDIIGNPFAKPFVFVKPIAVYGGYQHQKRDGRMISIGESGKNTLLDIGWLTPQVISLATAAYEDRPGRKCWSCDGYGNHLGAGPDRGNPECSTCHGTGHINDGTLYSLTLLALADALEEAGCDNEDILRHLRGLEWVYGQLSDSWFWHHLPGPHVRGCWALDFILGRE